MSGARIDMDNLVCRFFVTTGCKDGSKCLLPHDTSPNRVPDEICRFYLNGLCVFGNYCRYDHIPIRSLMAVKIERPALKSWADAPVFVPRMSHECNQKSYAAALGQEFNPISNTPLCSYYENCVECPYGSSCRLIHGDVCDTCGKACLHPFNAVFNAKHAVECERQLEDDMELSFAKQRSVGMACGICMDVIVDKESDRRFGILENCKHVYCLGCIRKWRGLVKQGNSSELVAQCLTYACPECRVVSGMVIPSSVWVEDADEKAKLVSTYKKSMGSKPCRYFRQGEGKCPFGGSCFYLHATPDGTPVTTPSPEFALDQSGRRVEVRNPNLLDFIEFRDSVGEI